MFYIYAHENSKGEIIYIGQTITFGRRLGQHLTQSKWGDEIFCARVIETAETEEEALRVESDMILKHAPVYNSTGNVRRDTSDYLKVPADKFNSHGLIHIDDYLSLFKSKYEASRFNNRNDNFFYRFASNPIKVERYFSKRGEMYVRKEDHYKFIPNFNPIKPMIAV